MNKKRIYLTLAAGLALIGMTFSCVPFISSLKPNRANLYKWQTEIDISNQREGELVRYKSLYRDIWVYKRTPDQVKWLSLYSPTATNSYVLKNSKSESFGGNFRSIDPEIFVFTAWVYQEKVYLQESKFWYPCGSINYYPDNIILSDGRNFKGVLACVRDNESEPNFDNQLFVYDVAGVAKSDYVASLEVPFYEFDSKGNIVVGPRP